MTSKTDKIAKTKYADSVPRSRTAQSWIRFRTHKRGWWSFCLLIIFYLISLCSEFICNDKPLWIRVNGKNFFPVLFTYQQNDLLMNGVSRRMTDYKSLIGKQDVRILMPFFTSGPEETLSPDELERFRRLNLELRPVAHTAAIQLSADFAILNKIGEIEYFSSLIPSVLEYCKTNSSIRQAVDSRLNNKSSPAVDLELADGAVLISLAPFTPRTAPPNSVRLFLRSRETVEKQTISLSSRKSIKPAERWTWLSDEDAQAISETIEEAKSRDWIPPVEVSAPSLSPEFPSSAIFSASLETVSWPFRPVPGHPMGFDSAGRDVLARILYATRISLTFGLLLVTVTCLIGIIAGAVQGYFAGWVDITGQRLTEIWSALPFLYIIILLGNTLGRGFGLLLACYALFNWIGIATYTRAEFLRLRTRAFVEAARCQGLSGTRIMFRHILPNALTPIITLLPFSLVGAIGSLTVLDYLGFGLPPGTPSWGTLLQEAQSHRSAWWLILYPSLALFIVMLLGVFIGEGMRDALDPKPYSKME